MKKKKFNKPRRKSFHQDTKTGSIPNPGSIMMLHALVREEALSFQVSVTVAVSVDVILNDQLCWLMSLQINRVNWTLAIVTV